MNRETIYQVLELAGKPDPHLTPPSFQRGWAACLRVVKSYFDQRLKDEAIGPDEWRVPPGAPNPDGLPVEAFDRSIIGQRVWFRGREWLTDPGMDGSVLLYAHGDTLIVFDLGAIEAWRPAAVGPGGGA